LDGRSQQFLTVDRKKPGAPPRRNPSCRRRPGRGEDPTL